MALVMVLGMALDKFGRRRALGGGEGGHEQKDQQGTHKQGQVTPERHKLAEDLHMPYVF